MGKVAAALKADKWRDTLTMDFAGIKQLDDSALALLVCSLPMSLTILELGISDRSLCGVGAIRRVLVDAVR